MITISQLTGGTMYRVPVVVQGHRVAAVVDTAAQVTLISEEMYKGLKEPPPILKEVVMNTAGKGLQMNGFVAGPFYIKLGNQEFTWDIYVAPIGDQMLLGIDFLRKQGISLDLHRNQLSIHGEVIQMSWGQASSLPQTTEVRAGKNHTVPANSVQRVMGVLAKPMGREYIIEAKAEGCLLIPRTLHDVGQDPVLCLINLTDSPLVISKGDLLAQAQEVDMGEPPGPKVCKMGVAGEVKEKLLPQHLQEMFTRSCEDLSKGEEETLCSLLQEFQDVFASSDLDLGHFTALEHGIDTGNHPPIKQRMRRTPLGFAQEEEAHLEKMLQSGVIQPSVSEWASAPVLIRKRDGSVRWCVDYRRVNGACSRQIFALPLVEECLDTLAGNVWYSKLDANSAYWQVKIKEEDRPKTAFITKYGLFEFARMAFGLCNAPATYARVISLVLRGLTWRVVLAFLDDILVLGRDFGDHLANLRVVFERFRTYGLKLKPRKCDLFRKKVEFLGRVVGPEGMKIGPGYVKDVKNWPEPRNSKEVERFLGFANYHRAFIKDYTNIALPLQALTGKRPYFWGNEQQQSFDRLREAMVSAPVLSLPNATDPFILDTDASDKAIGAELLQVQGGQERATSYASFTLTPEQQKYCTTRKELLAIVRFTRLFRHYLLGRRFTVRTDHSSLTWLTNFKEPQGQLARWLEEISQFDMEIKHRPGAKHPNADALSRLPQYGPCPEFQVDKVLANLPCGGCTYCARAQQNWGQFTENVDDTIPLAKRPYGSTQPKDTREPVVQISRVSVSKRGDELAIWSEGEGDIWVQEVGGDLGVNLGYSQEELKENQSKDPDLKWVVQWRKTKGEPSEEEIFLSGPAPKYYWLNRELFVLSGDNILYRKGVKGEADRVVIPQVSRKELMELCHDIPAAGHQGGDRTYQRIKPRYYWRGMKKEIEQYVASCALCSQNKRLLAQTVTLW